MHPRIKNYTEPAPAYRHGACPVCGSPMPEAGMKTCSKECRFADRGGRETKPKMKRWERYKTLAETEPHFAV